MIRQLCRSVPTLRGAGVACARSRWTGGAVTASLCAAAIAVLAGLARPAAAEPARDPSPSPGVPPVLTSDGLVGRRIAVDTPIDAYATPAAQVSPTIFLNRCSGGCTVHMGNNDARTDTSTIPTPSGQLPGPNFSMTEFENSAMQSGAAADVEWGMLLQCMKEVYSPYQVTVTDVRPATGLNYHEAIVAGNPGEIGLGPDILGVAPLAGDCSAIDNVISFSFANHHPRSMMDPSVLILNLCWTAAQESAHAYGLDHEYSFATGNALNAHSACNDPMTYRNDCGGEKFFRNEIANCGETANRTCKCGGTQNSHLKILGVFGPGTPITGNPTSALTSLTAGGTLGGSIAVQAGARRGVSHVELYFNGYKWADTPGAPFGTQGQANPSNYAIPVPAALPNSIVDVKAIAYDDLGAATESAVVTVTKGAACTSADACAKGQKCEMGKCFWEPATGEIGAACSYNQFCKDGLCTGTADEQICTKNCIPGSMDSCPSGLECLASGPSTGVCFFSSTGGGCCRVDRGGAGGLWWAQLGLAAVVLGWVTRRRQR